MEVEKQTMKPTIAELEAEIIFYKNRIREQTEENQKLQKQVLVRGERMEFMKAHMRGYDYEHLRHAKINRWFNDNGKVRDE